MKKTLRTAVASAVAAVSLLGLAACSSGASAESDKSPIVFGVSGPLTGNQAEYGKNWQDGFALALQQVNANGGINGRKVTIDFQDSQGDASQATTIAQRFVSDDKISAVMGDFSSATSMVASPIYQRGGLLQLGITNSHPDFTKTGDYIFSPAVTQDVDASYLEDGVAKLGKKAAVFYLNTDWGNTAFDVFKKEADKNSTDIVYSTGVEEGSTDFRPQLIKARDSGADVLAFITYYDSTSLLAQQAKQAGLTGLPMVASGSNYSQQFLDLAKSAADGVYMNTSFFPGSDRAEVKDFSDAFTKKFGTAPNLFNAFAYDGVEQLVAAFKASDGTREGIRNALRDGKKFQSVVFGPFHYNAERRIDNPTFTWLVVKDDAFVETKKL